jgi:hypothetical protein
VGDAKDDNDLDANGATKDPCTAALHIPRPPCDRDPPQVAPEFRIPNPGTVHTTHYTPT